MARHRGRKTLGSGSSSFAESRSGERSPSSGTAEKIFHFNEPQCRPPMHGVVQPPWSTMPQYAATTSVSVEKSRAEIENILARYGAGQFGYATDSDRGLATIQFTANDRHIRFVLQLPKRNDKQFWYTPAGRKRLTPQKQVEAWEQACRQRWRALALAIKAKLEAVECGIAEFEEEFMANIVLPNGQTVGGMMRPQIAHAYMTGETPPGIAGLLPAPKDEDAVDADFETRVG